MILMPIWIPGFRCCLSVHRGLGLDRLTGTSLRVEGWLPQEIRTEIPKISIPSQQLQTPSPASNRRYFVPLWSRNGSSCRIFKPTAPRTFILFFFFLHLLTITVTITITSTSTLSPTIPTHHSTIQSDPSQVPIHITHHVSCYCKHSICFLVEGS